ncbi:unnamed protein product [Oppiella nova]|uniref:NR LBD domain-containing protein n=1 Tax=Oppiella nova TaxID=334625 RepID=A0A7R9M964_9ACAR|nr:unnamed protein product [Oppiella nova]CAG2173133.1 unnamed protein product [Oppiella nova]
MTKLCITLEEWILSDEEKQILRKKVEENRKNRLMATKGVDTTGHTSLNAKSHTICHNILADITDGNVSGDYSDESNPLSLDIDTEDHVLSLDFDALTDSDFTLSDTITDNMETKELLDIDNNIVITEKTQTEVDGNHEPNYTQTIVPIQRPITDYNNNFNETEGNCLAELLSAMAIVEEPVCTDGTDVTTFQDMRRVMTKKFDIGIRSVIQMSKRLPSFRSISENDKYILVKNSCVEILHLRSALIFDYENGLWNIFIKNGETFRVKFESMKENPFEFYDSLKKFLLKVKLECGFDSLIFDLFYDSLKKFLLKVKLECGFDSLIFDLLTAILLFNPSLPDLTHRDVIKFQQKLYLYLLKRYLMIKYQPDSDVKCAKILSIITDLHVLAHLHRQITAQRDPKQIGPLLQEVYSMK